MKHPTEHRTVPQQPRMIQPQMSAVPQVKKTMPYVYVWKTHQYQLGTSGRTPVLEKEAITVSLKPQLSILLAHIRYFTVE